MAYLQVGCCCLLGLVFLVSAVSKVRDLEGFAASLPGLAPFLKRARTGSARRLALVVIALEFLTPVLLAIPRSRPYAFGLAGCLLTAFTIAIAVAVRRGHTAPCRCFGASDARLGPRHLVRNTVLLATAIAGLSSPGHGLPPVAGVAVAAVAGLVGAVLIVSFDDIVDLFAGSL